MTATRAQPLDRPIVLVGYGDIARRLAERLSDRDIVAIARHAPERPAGHKGRWVGMALDLDTDIRPSVADAPGATWVYLAPPARKGREDTRVARWLSGAASTPEAMIYISTTGVYGDHRGGWVDESTPPRPAHDRGWRRLDAEQRFEAQADQHHIPLTVLRVAGIYACDRLPVEKIRRGAPVPAGPDAPWSNRIHADDLADILAQLIDRLDMHHPVSGTFNVSDNHPTPVNVIYGEIASHFGLPQPPETSLESVLAHASPMAREFLSESRRINARAIQRALGWQPRYQTLATTLADCSPQE
ncbi:SDR family NAD(P)-dependent oxidoreductase [Guyparkeria hydrothermalis]|uniref:SDR family NAD(P)-dependent oxidoreductase n=1 Tax=Guyparkeria hydrothermalis TaxID=923 RepID=UPI0020222C4C|nr:SDR family NAD(P)-dependent oxidoreductase [Guyparkeria hydrothermalis]MCL7745261.1 SDR family NAD(P)-dependent oxidoreductase [Guyparkeria hydrothermalis]